MSILHSPTSLQCRARIVDLQDYKSRNQAQARATGKQTQWNLWRIGQYWGHLKSGEDSARRAVELLQAQEVEAAIAVLRRWESMAKSSPRADGCTQPEC